jgi:3-oxoacyl-[acyl-carrier protein] reductase
MDIRLDGRSAVITGGSKGWAWPWRRGLPRPGRPSRSSRAPPRHWPRPSSRSRPEPKGKIATVSADVSKVADSRRAYDQVMSELGKIDILVNNAGQATSGPSEEVTDEM